MFTAHEFPCPIQDPQSFAHGELLSICNIGYLDFISSLYVPNSFNVSCSFDNFSYLILRLFVSKYILENI